MSYTKAVRRKLRQLVTAAYEKELCLELEKLSVQFGLWKEGKIDVWDLEEAIHKFHNGPSRKLYSRYVDLPPETIVPYALAKKLVSFEDVPDEIVEEMRMKAKFYQDNT